jgi:hypothetical protein
MRLSPASRGWVRALRRPASYRPELLPLEDRLPLGDAVLGPAVSAKTNCLNELRPLSLSSEAPTPFRSGTGPFGREGTVSPVQPHNRR